MKLYLLNQLNHLRNLKKQWLINGAITREEIRVLYKGHAVFLIPTRHITQDASRDEGMSSALVLALNNIGAVRSFFDKNATMVDKPDFITMKESFEKSTKLGVFLKAFWKKSL